MVQNTLEHAPGIYTMTNNEQETKKMEAKTRKTDMIYCIDQKTVFYYPTCRNADIQKEKNVYN